MKKNWLYLKYLARHKYFVFIAGLKFKVSIWTLLIHDWSKFLPAEWPAYREFFYGDREKDGRRPQEVKDAFKKAWLHHIHLNPHHWNYYAYADDGGTEIIHIPDRYLREMIADWYGAGRAITGEWRAPQWYEENKGKILLHPDTRAALETYLASVRF